MRRRAWLLPCFAALVGVVGALSCRRAPAGPHTPTAGSVSTSLVRSNVTRADYAGSEACRSCHAELHERWSNSPMHGMTRLPDGADIRAPFAEGEGTPFRFKDDSVRLQRVDARRYMLVDTRENGKKLYRVTKVIGGHHREDFAGLEVEGTVASAKVIGSSDAERILPVSYMIATKALRYKGYSVMERERPGLRVAGEWNKRCIFCHNTEPYLDVALGALASRVGPEPPPHQGEVVDTLLRGSGPSRAPRRMAERIRDQHRVQRDAVEVLHP